MSYRCSETGCGGTGCRGCDGAWCDGAGIIASSLDAGNPMRPGTLQTGVYGGWTPAPPPGPNDEKHNQENSDPPFLLSRFFGWGWGKNRMTSADLSEKRLNIPH